MMIDSRHELPQSSPPEEAGESRKPSASSKAVAAPASGVQAFIACVKAQLLLPFRPRSAARCTANVKLPIVFLAHAVCMLFGLVLCFLASTFLVFAMDATFSRRPWVEPRFGSYYNFVLAGFREAWEALFYPESWFAITTVVLVIEGGLAFLAGLLLPVAAANEPLAGSVRRSLRTAWLAAPMLFWFIFGMFIAGTIHDALGSTLLAEIPRYQWPFPLYRDEQLVGLAAALMGIWVLWALFRAASVRPANSDHSATTNCESCGYELSHTPIESRCPECGEPAADSLGQGLRRPNAWELARTFSPTGYLHITVDVLLAPGRFFRTMPVWSGANRAFRYLLVSAVLTGLLADASFLLFDLASHPLRRITFDNVFSRANLEILTFLPFIAFGCLLGFVLATAAWLGMQLSRGQQRNMLLPAAKVCYYATALYIVWLPLNAVLWAGLEFFTRAGQLNLLPERFRYGLSRGDQVAFVMLVLNAFLPVLIWRYHRIGLRAVMHANR